MDNKIFGPRLRLGTPVGECSAAKGHRGSVWHDGEGTATQQQQQSTQSAWAEKKETWISCMYGLPCTVVVTKKRKAKVHHKNYESYRN